MDISSVRTRRMESLDVTDVRIDSVRALAIGGWVRDESRFLDALGGFACFFSSSVSVFEIPLLAEPWRFSREHAHSFYRPRS